MAAERNPVLLLVAHLRSTHVHQDSKIIGVHSLIFPRRPVIPFQIFPNRFVVACSMVLPSAICASRSFCPAGVQRSVQTAVMVLHTTVMSAERGHNTVRLTGTGAGRLG